MERELLATLDRNGVVRVNPQGEKFDPNRHQAVMEQENAEVPSGSILQVLQSGYSIGERTLRPAVVIVSRGGPKVAKVAEKPVEPGATVLQPEMPATEEHSPLDDPAAG